MSDDEKIYTELQSDLKDNLEIVLKAVYENSLLNRNIDQDDIYNNKNRIDDILSEIGNETGKNISNKNAKIFLKKLISINENNDIYKQGTIYSNIFNPLLSAASEFINYSHKNLLAGKIKTKSKKKKAKKSRKSRKSKKKAKKSRKQRRKKKRKSKST